MLPSAFFNLTLTVTILRCRHFRTCNLEEKWLWAREEVSHSNKLRDRHKGKKKLGESGWVCCESLAQWERRCLRTNWVSAWAMSRLASKPLSSARAGGRLWEVKLAKMKPYGDPWCLMRCSFEGASGQLVEDAKQGGSDHKEFNICNYLKVS